MTVEALDRVAAASTDQGVRPYLEMLPTPPSPYVECCAQGVRCSYRPEELSRAQLLIFTDWLRWHGIDPDDVETMIVDAQNETLMVIFHGGNVLVKALQP